MSIWWNPSIPDTWGQIKLVCGLISGGEILVHKLFLSFNILVCVLISVGWNSVRLRET